MNIPKKNPERKRPKELPWAILTAAGFSKPLQYLLILSAVAGGTICSSKMILEKQENEREGIKVLLQPPKNEDSANPLPENTSAPLDQAFSDQESTNVFPEPVEQQKLQEIMKELEEAYREGDGIYDLIKKAKEQLPRNELKTFMERIVEMTDDNFPLPTEGMTEEEKDEFYKNELENELRRRDVVRTQFAESIATDLVLDDPILQGFLLDALERSEREERAKSTSTDIPIYHRLRNRMIGYLCSNILRYRSETPLRYRLPEQTIHQLRKDLTHLEILGYERIDEYRRYVANAGG